MSTYIDPGYGDYIAVDGHIVEKHALYIVEKIKAINPNLEVICLDPDWADNPFEEPFMICERVGDQVFKIFGCWELNDSVLERIHLADTKKFDVQAIIDETNKKVREETTRRYIEKREAKKDIVASTLEAMESNKSSYSFTREEDGAKVTLYDDRPAKVEHE